VDASVDTRYPRPIRQLTNGRAASFEQTQARLEPQPVIDGPQEPVVDLLGHVARLEASTGAALALLRRCMVEHKSPTREALVAEAGFAFGMPGEAALAEMDEVAQMVGISSLR
jgi:hypothetical protein